MFVLSSFLARFFFFNKNVPTKKDEMNERSLIGSLLLLPAFSSLKILYIRRRWVKKLSLFSFLSDDEKLRAASGAQVHYLRILYKSPTSQSAPALSLVYD